MVKEQVLSYEKIRKPLHDTIIAMENMIEREWPNKYAHLGSAKATFFMWIKVADVSFKTMLFIGQDKLESNLSKLELCLSIPSLTRIIYDTLFNVIYMSDDFERRSLDFWKSGWKDTVKSARATEMHFKDYASTEEIEAFRVKEKEVLDMHRHVAEISNDEEKNIRKIKKWPLAHSIIEQVKDKDAKAFLVFIYDCYQNRLGAHGHLSWVGLAERAFFFEEIVDREQRKEKLKAFKSNWLLLSITFLLALLSEINNVLNFGCNQSLLTLWFILKEYSTEAAKFYDMRYSKMLRKKQ